MSAAQAADIGPYVRADVGASFISGFSLSSGDLSQSVNNTPATEPVFGIGVGYRFTPAFRADLGVSYRPSADFSGTDQPDQLGLSSHVSSWRGFVTGYVDIPGLLADGALGRFSPYVGMGLGFAHNSLHDVAVTDLTAPASANRLTLAGADRTSLAWQGVAGFGYQLTDKMVLDASYHYVDAGQVKSGTSLTGAGGSAVPANILSGSLTSHELVLGLRYSL